MRWMKKSFLLVIGLLLLPALASAGDAEDARAKVAEANNVISEIMASPDKGIPHDLLHKAAGVAIFPGVLKAGFVFGGKYGRGIVVRHEGGKWSTPAFYSIGAGSVGWQIGASSTDLILLIRSERGLKSLLNNEFTLGGDVAVAAGPVGRNAEAGTDVGLKAEILSYSRSRGLFAGLSLEGSKVNVLDKYNKAYYGAPLTPEEILYKGKGKATAESNKLSATLQKYSE